MMKIKIKANGRRFSFPVPYALLNLCSGILTSKRLLALINRAIEKDGKKKFQIPDIDRKELKPLLLALSQHKGLVLVETTLKDGTEVLIRL